MLREAIAMTQKPSIIIRGPFYITILLTVLFYRRLRKLLRRRVVLSLVIVLGVITCSVTSFHFTALRETLRGSREYQFAKRVKNAAQRVVVKSTTPEQQTVFALSNQDLYRRVAPSVVLVSCPGKGYGTGFFYGRDGIIVTNHHVMQGVEHAEIITHRGQKYPVHGIVAEDAANDLILLSTGIPPDEIRALTVNTSVRCRRQGRCRQPPQGLYRCPCRRHHILRACPSLGGDPARHAADLRGKREPRLQFTGRGCRDHPGR